MRTDKEVPVAPPGGLFWGHKGCMDGLRDKGKEQRKPAPARFEPVEHTLPAPLSGPRMA